MTLSKAQLYRETFEAAIEFHALRLWETFDDQVCFPVHLPSSATPVFLSIMGSGGQEHGLVLFRGPNAGVQLFGTLASEAMDDGAADALDTVSFGMSPLHEMPPPGREFLRAAKVSAKRNDLVPLFIAKEPGKHARPLSRDEVGDMLMVLRGLAKALRQGRLTPSPVVPGAATREYAFSGDPRDPEVSIANGVFPIPEKGASPLVASPGGLGGLPRLSAAWVIGYPVLPISVDDVEGSVRCLMVADVNEGFVLQGEIPERMDLQEAIEILRGTFRGKNLRKQKGLPSSAAFTDRELHDVFAPTLAELGVECSYQPGHPLLEGIKASMSEWLASGKTISSTPRSTRTTAPHASDPPPAPGDLEAWKLVDRVVGDKLGQALISGRRPSDRALAQYFGTARIGRKFLEGERREMAFGAFFEWAALNYRAGEKSATAAEKVLNGSLPEAERQLLADRCAGRPSIYRVAGIEPGARLTLDDLLFGGSVVVTDRLLSQSAEPGYCLVGVVFPAGGFHFLVMTGPPLGLGEVSSAVRYLEEQGLDQSPDGIGATSHLFGRLWNWLDRERARRPRVPRMVNFDGDPLEMHTAHFTVTDEAAARAALAKRSDLEFDDDGQSASWEPAGTRHADRMPGGKVAAGRLRFEAGEIVFETNSAERYRKARAWLDKIPGVAFSSLEAQSPEAAFGGRERAPRERTSSAAPAAEELEQVQRMLDEQYMKWLDEKIPALGGKTPRQACKTDRGRREVALMIRTYPDPGGMPGLTVPRGRMLKELGLSDAPESH